MRFEKVAVIGLGYIGLPTAAVLASRKIEVIGVDALATRLHRVSTTRGMLRAFYPFG